MNPKSATNSIDSYLEVMQTLLEDPQQDDVWQQINSWNLPLQYWDILEGYLPVGSVAHRKLVRVGAKEGHPKSIALAVVFAGGTVSGQKNEPDVEGQLSELSKAPENTRKLAGLLAPTWKGSLWQLLEAVQDGLCKTN